jgi:hypothetical protein
MNVTSQFFKAFFSHSSKGKLSGDISTINENSQHLKVLKETSIDIKNYLKGLMGNLTYLLFSWRSPIQTLGDHLGK